jgi:hypothetical protein
MDVDTCRAQLLDDRGHLVGAANAAQRKVPSIVRERTRDGEADAASSARHERYPRSLPPVLG